MRPRRLDMPWGRLRLWEAGDGPSTILALHGLGGSGRYWDGLAEALGPGFLVLAPDLGGFGGSSKPSEPADRAFHLMTLDRVAETSAEGPVIVVGHSLGGVLGLLWAARRTEDVLGLALAASPFPSPRPDWDPATLRTRRGTVAKMVVTTARVAWPLLSVPVQAFGPYPAPVVRDYGRQSLPNRVWTLWSLWGDPSLGTEVEGATDAIREAGLPVAVAHADDDRSVGPANARAWRDRLPHAQDIDVPVGGHQFLLKVGFGSLVPWLRGVQVGGHG